MLLGLALAAALLLSAATGALALGTSPPPAPGKPAQSAPAAAPPAQPAGTPAPPAKPTGAPATAQPVAGAIATPDIPIEADRLLTVLRGLEERVGPTPALLTIETSLPEMAQRIADAQLETKGEIPLPQRNVNLHYASREET